MSLVIRVGGRACERAWGGHKGWAPQVWVVREELKEYLPADMIPITDQICDP